MGHFPLFFDVTKHLKTFNNITVFLNSEHFFRYLFCYEYQNHFQNRFHCFGLIKGKFVNYKRF